MRKYLTLGTATAILFISIGVRVWATPVLPIWPKFRQAAPAPAEVERLYRLHCQMCHGAGGKAPLPEMAFVGRDWKHGTSSKEMAKVIADGVAGTPMMPFKNKLKPEQITALAKHVRAFDKRLKPEK